VGALTVVLALSACGSSQEKTETLPVTGPGAPVGASTPRAAIIEFFEAKRVGDTKRGCELESEDFQKAQYMGTGEACLKSSVNQHPQKVWAEEVKIDKLEEAPDSAAATIRPNAGNNTPAEITLVRGKGGWLVNSLR
jgi:hypothetical protein